MKNWQLIKQSVQECRGVDATYKIFRILENYVRETKNMTTDKEKMEYLEKRCSYV